MTEQDQEMFVNGFNATAAHIEDWANRKGWNGDDPLPHTHFSDPDVVHYDIAKYMLMVTELAEAVEGRRHGDPLSDKIAPFSAQEEELADCIIRIMHYAAHRKLRVADALMAKLAYNEERPYKHGKLA